MKKSLVANASDPQQVAEAVLREKLADDNTTARLQALMALPEFRREMWLLLGETHVFDSIFVTNSEIYYRAGQQDVGHWLMKRLASAAPESYLLMQREAAQLETQKPDHTQTEGDA